jgi:tetratricopeptide (TPR) repeat protein
MLFSKKFVEGHEIYGIEDEVKEIYLVENEVEVRGGEGQTFILKNFPVGLIEKSLKIPALFDYVVLEETKYKIVNDIKEFSFILKSFHRVHEYYSDSYFDNVYYAEKCFVEDMRRFIFETLTGKKFSLKKSYISDARENSVFSEYFSYLKEIGSYFKEFDVRTLLYYEALKDEADDMLEFKEYDKALEKYMKIIEHTSFMTAENYNNISKIYFYKKNLDMAINFAKKAIECDEKFYKAYHNLAVYNYFKGEIYEAKELWEEVLKINPSHEKAKRNLKVLSEALGN